MLIQIVIALLVVGILIALMEWATKQIPGFPPIIRTIIYVVVVVVLVLWLLSAFGLTSSSTLPKLP